MKVVEKSLQWNMGCWETSAGPQQLIRAGTLQKLVSEHRPSILALQEAPDSLLGIDTVMTVLRQDRLSTAIDPGRWDILEEFRRPRFLAVVLRHRRTGLELTLYNIHGKSYSHTQVHQRQEFFRNHVRREINSRRLNTPERAELLLGDFNMEPSDEVIVQPSGLWANRSLAWARQNKRKSSAPDFPLFNASWAIYGRARPPLGTYYLGSSENSEGPWYVFDQAIFSPELGRDGEHQCELVELVDGKNLCGDTELRIPNETLGSDHLPVITTVCIQS